jgi:hypothetical protein
VSPPCRVRRYEACWERENSLAAEVKIAWENHNKPKNLGDVVANLEGVMDSLQSWSKRTVGSVSKRIGKLRKKLANVNMNLSTVENQRNKKKYETELDSLLEQEEVYWRQRSRVTWLREGDRNTKLFHRKATWRAKKNKILRLKKEDGSTTQNTAEMESLTTSFFQNLYMADPNVQPAAILDSIEPIINHDANGSLCAEFSDEEISFAMFQIGPLKAPGSDGFPARFYQRHWGVLKHDIIAAVKDFFKTGHMPDGVNDTVIVLIPKKKNPEFLRDFRPISLCNVIYKVVSKCLVNRLRPLLQDIIAPTQSAFIPGRLITDNALIAFECINTIQKSNDKKGKFCAYKLDLAKAYDRVDWTYLEGMLLKLGFAKQWISWIMTCVRSVKYSIRLNGNLLQKFAPTRGLRQGDPLSPYLFLFVAEGLSRLLRQEINSGQLNELKICRQSPGISHLLFADDSILFFEANMDQAMRVKSILSKYELATGQILSPDKCSLLLGNKCTTVAGQQVATALQVQSVGFEEKYLGLPVPEGRMKDGKFQPVKEKIKKRVTDYSEKYSSSGAKEVLIKSVIQ